MASIYDFTADDINGVARSLELWRGQVLLIVNVASKCGFTPQYEGLEALHAAHSGRGFAVLGFPCNQFGHQEPGDAAQIEAFCTSQYGISFPLFEKIDVNGPQSHPLYAWLKTEKSGVLGSQSIKWNFTKFLLGRDGQVQERYGSTTKPEALRRDIERALQSNATEL